MPVSAQEQQEVACGAGALWINGTEDASNVTSFEEPVQQVTLVPQNGAAVTLFTLSEQTGVRLEAEGADGGDTVIDLLDASGNLIGNDDDGGGALSSRLEVDLPAGTYCLQTRSFGGSLIPATVSIGLQSQEAMTEGLGAVGGGGAFGAPECGPDTEAQTLGEGALAPGGSLQATAPIGAVPFYRFTLESETPIVVTAENPDADPYVYLYDERGGLMGQNDDFDGLNSRLEMMEPLSAGSYCVALEALSDETQPVTVTVAEFDAAAAQQALIERGEIAPPLDGSYQVEPLGPLQTRLRASADAVDAYRYYTFDMPQFGLATVEAIGQGGADPIVVLYDEFGREIGWNDDGPQGLDSFLALELAPGTYILGVGQYGQAAAGGITVAMTRYVPAQ
ncbi:DVUA0089 family protein [Hasllibacter halocynthiae]|nr:DVUA0089 family protein [Hasllibacter halocynthiae]